MRKAILVLILLLAPAISYAFTASDFTVNNQPTYDVPRGTTQLLILDLTLPEVPSSITFSNAGVLLQSYISKLVVYEDGSSSGWDFDENVVATDTTWPFFGEEISGNFSKKRIFVTMDFSTTTVSESTIRLKLGLGSVKFASGKTGPTDKDVFGFERKIVLGADVPTIPVPPLAKSGEAISTSTIRWHFTDMSNNEFGFRVKNSNLNVVAKKETANLSYLDETGLLPNTEYSGRRVYAFNDRGESISSVTFDAVNTLAETPKKVELPKKETPVIEKTPAEEKPVEVQHPPVQLTADELRLKIQEIQLKIIDLLSQLIKLLQEQIASR